MKRITDPNSEHFDRVEIYDAVDDKLVYWGPATARENLARQVALKAEGKGQRYWLNKDDAVPAEVDKAREAFTAETREQLKVKAEKDTIETLQAKARVQAEEISEMREMVKRMEAMLAAKEEAPPPSPPPPSAPKAKAKAPVKAKSED